MEILSLCFAQLWQKTKCWQENQSLRLGLLGRAVDADDHSVIAVIRLEGQLLLGLKLVLLETVALGGVDDVGGGGGINAIGLDGDDELATVLQEHGSVERDDTGLIRLRDIGEDAIDHADQHAVAERLAGVLDDRDDVRALLGHVGKITSRAVRELNSINNAIRADHVRNMRNSGTRRTTQVQDSHTRLDRHVTDAADDRSSNLGTERVPHTVLDLLFILLNRNTLLAIHTLTGDQVTGHKRIILTLGDKAALVTMGLDDGLGGASLAFTLALALTLAFAFTFALALAFSKAFAITFAKALAFASFARRFSHDFKCVLKNFELLYVS